MRHSTKLEIDEYVMAFIQQDIISLGCLLPACQPCVLWWPVLERGGYPRSHDWEGVGIHAPWYTSHSLVYLPHHLWYWPFWYTHPTPPLWYTHPCSIPPPPGRDMRPGIPTHSEGTWDQACTPQCGSCTPVFEFEFRI